MHPIAPHTTPCCPLRGDALPVDSADGGGEILLQPHEEALYHMADTGLIPALQGQTERAGMGEGVPTSPWGCGAWDLPHVDQGTPLPWWVAAVQ